jgi:hypothetical protein
MYGILRLVTSSGVQLLDVNLRYIQYIKEVKRGNSNSRSTKKCTPLVNVKSDLAYSQVYIR